VSSSEKAAGKQRGRPFKKGVSGNPAGKPKGARHKTTILAEKLMADDGEAIVKKVVEAAKAGDLQAARLVLDRICPSRKDSPITFTVPRIQSSADAAEAMSALLAAVAAGEITPSEATEVARLLEGFLRAREGTEIEARLAALESAQERTP
jgi:hypothetical protein